MSEILPNLYLGDQRDALHFYDVDLVINCTTDLPFYTYKAKQIRIPVKDNGDPKESLMLYEIIDDNEIFQIIDSYLEDKKKVLIHCRAGQQRSCAVVACYLIYKYNYDPYQAIATVQVKRPCAFFGGINFMDTIKYYSKSY
jgi:protein-tyrosine phosphatase